MGLFCFKSCKKAGKNALTQAKTANKKKAENAGKNSNKKQRQSKPNNKLLANVVFSPGKNSFLKATHINVLSQKNLAKIAVLSAGHAQVAQ
ncbi:MAG: hypothetical protein HY394_03495 [Candidatus Diapherotrites archaeon]|nr:hypothetical protein [Candidatus Diapherotrites archaeon]